MCMTCVCVYVCHVFDRCMYVERLVDYMCMYVLRHGSLICGHVHSMWMARDEGHRANRGGILLRSESTGRNFSGRAETRQGSGDRGRQAEWAVFDMCLACVRHVFDMCLTCV